MNFAYTLQVPNFKQVNYNGKRKAFGKMTLTEQMDYLDYLKRMTEDDYLKQISITYERHKDGRYHAHGTIFNSSLPEMVQIQSSICIEVGVKTQKQFNEIFCYVPIYNMGGWDTYCKKDIPPEYEESDQEDPIHKPYYEVFTKI